MAAGLDLPHGAVVPPASNTHKGLSVFAVTSIWEARTFPALGDTLHASFTTFLFVWAEAFDDGGLGER